MILEDSLLMKIKDSLTQIPTKHLIIVDTDVCRRPDAGKRYVKRKITQHRDILTRKVIRKDWLEPIIKSNVAWLEPERGIYIIDLSILIHFRKNLEGNVRELLQEITNVGFTVKSIRFGKFVKREVLKIKKKQTENKHKIAIVAMFSPKGLVAHWERFLLRSELPPNTEVDIIMGDNSGTRMMESGYEKYKSALKHKYNNFYYCDLGKPHVGKEGDHYLEINKHAHVAATYSKLLMPLLNKYDYILKIEDDVEPPDNGISRLYYHMRNFEKNNKKIASVGGYYPQKINPDTICVSLQPEIWGKVPRISELQARLFRVEMQGGGFTLYKAEALKEVLPYRLTFKKPRGNAYMTGWDGTMGETWSNNGWEQYCDGSMYCLHHF